MQLATEMIRLPLRFDAERLAAEVLAIDESAWRPHPQGYAGNSALLLLAAGGDPADDAAAGSMRPTPWLLGMPYLRQVLAAFGAPIGRTRLMRLDGNAEATAHADTNYYWIERMRVHVPIVTTPGVMLTCGERQAHLAAGEAWIFDTWRIHSVVNPEPTRRIHLVADTVGSAELAALIEDGAWPFAEPPRPGAPHRFVPYRPGFEPDLATEERNQPTVMTPWELRAHRERLLADLAAARRDAAPAGAEEKLARELLDLERRWRALWARHGDAPAALARYRAALGASGERLSRLAGRVRTTNRLDAVEVVRQWILRPALGEAAGRGPTAPAGVAVAGGASTASPVPAPVAGPTPSGTVLTATRRASAGAAPPRRFARPVFIVCPPRSGSSLLFETLAQSPDAWTIGGESHAQFENLPALHPERRQWSSNRLTAADLHPGLLERLVDALFLPLRDRDGKRPAAGAEGLRLVEKTPKNALRVPFLAAAFPDAQFVYLYRNPRETINSMYEAWQSGRFVTYPRLPGWIGPSWSLALVPGWRELAGRPLAEVVARQWQAITDQLRDDLEQLAPERWCVANYGALISRPQQEVERLCGFLGLAWDRTLTVPLPVAHHTLTPPAAGKWRRNAAVLEPVLPLVAATAERTLELFAHRPGHAGLDPAELAADDDEAPPTGSGGPPASGTAVEPTPPAGSSTPATAAAAVVAAPEAPASPVVAAPAPSASMPARGGGAASRPAGSALRSVHTTSLAEILTAVGGTLAVTTYQSGYVVMVRADDKQVNTHFAAYPGPMGLAVGPRYLALGTKHHVWEFRDVPAAAPRVQPAGRHDACYLPRRQHFTGDLRVHELAFAGEQLWLVATRFSCLATLDADHSFVPRWRPPFVSALAPEDRCHLNGLAVADSAPSYVTALGATDTAEGWRAEKASGGVLLDVASGERVAGGLSMPHSPRLHRGRLWLLESGKGELNVVDPASGRVETVARLPGFTRGLAFAGPFAFVGLSQVRESVFGGLPLSQRLEERQCGVWVVDLRNGRVAGFLRFEDAVQEIFDVQFLAGLRFPHFSDAAGEILETTYVVPTIGPVAGVAAPTT